MSENCDIPYNTHIQIFSDGFSCDIPNDTETRLGSRSMATVTELHCDIPNNTVTYLTIQRQVCAPVAWRQ